MKCILQILFIFTVYLSHSQVRITHRDETGKPGQDEFHPKAQMIIYFSQNLDSLFTDQEGFGIDVDHYFKILEICKNKNKIRITTPLNEDTSEKRIEIIIDKKSKSIQFDLGKGPKKFEGRGVQVIFLERKKLEICNL